MTGTTSANADDARQELLEHVIGSFLEAIDAGHQPDPQEWLARHPELSPELAEFFADRTRLQRLVARLRPEPELEPAPCTLPDAIRSGGDFQSPDEYATIERFAESEDTGKTASLPRGTQVRYFGDYKLLEELGRGGMGVVYKAQQLSLNRPVALKLLRSDVLASEDALRRFQNEAEAVALLDHPHIVPILEVGKHNGRHYFSMKLIGGASLDRKLTDYSDNPKAAARLMAKAADAVHHAHQRGILHRDLKPANILVDDFGEPHLTDFGLAKRVEGDSELTQSGAILGTPAYMAPEQAMGRRGAVTTSSDIYGLGAVLYALLAGRAPFHSDSVANTLHAVRERAPEPPSTINPKAPRDLEIVCLKCLDKDPARRFGSAQALANDVRRYLSGEPITARPTAAWERGWLWCKRNPWLAGACAITAASFVAVAVISMAYAVAQAKARREISGLAKDLQSSLSESDRRLKMSNRNLTSLTFERGHAACERGEIGRGLLWLVESWRTAIATGDEGWRHTARASVSAWQQHYARPKAVFSHAGQISRVAFSPDGKTVLTASYDNSARLWNATTGQPLGLPLTHQAIVSAIAFSLDGQIVITGSDDETARLWDATTGQPLGLPLTHQSGVSAVAFSPDGKTVLTGSEDKTARLWIVTTGQPLGRPLTHQGGVTAVAFNPNGKTVVTGSDDRTAQLWDANTGQSLGRPLPHQDMVSAVAFSPDGQTVLTGSLDKTARLWDANTGRPVGPPLPHQGFVYAVAYSPDGQTVLTGSFDNVARLWDAKTGQLLGLPIKHKNAVSAVAFSPDSQIVLTGSFDNTARLWDAKTGQPLGPPMAHQDQIRAVAYSPDGKTVLTGSDDNTAQLWDAATVQPLVQTMTNDIMVSAVVFSPDGKTVLTGSYDSTARLWDATTGKPIGIQMTNKSAITAAAYSPDGKSVLTGSHDKTARLWNTTTGQPIGVPMAHEDIVFAVAYSPDGKNVLTGSFDMTARQWDATTGQPRGLPLRHPAGVTAVAYSPDGKTVLTGSFDNKARLWNATTGQRFGVRLAHQGTVSSVTFSPDGKTVLTGSFDNSARLWDATTGQQLGPPLVHQGGGVSAVAFSPDGKIVLTGSLDKTARLWGAATGKPLGPPLTHLGAVHAVAYSPDGKTVLTGSMGNAARLWDVLELPDSQERVATWVQVITGLDLDDRGSVSAMDSATRHERREMLDKLGGQPMTASRWSLGTILLRP